MDYQDSPGNRTQKIVQAFEKLAAGTKMSENGNKAVVSCSEENVVKDPIQEHSVIQDDFSGKTGTYSGSSDTNVGLTRGDSKHSHLPSDTEVAIKDSQQLETDSLERNVLPKPALSMNKSGYGNSFRESTRNDSMLLENNHSTALASPLKAPQIQETANSFSDVALNDDDNDYTSTVHTADCVPLEPPKMTNKYVLNANFNKESPSAVKDSRIQEENSIHSDQSYQDWMPSVLKDQSWPQSDRNASGENTQSYRQRIRKKSSRFDVPEQPDDNSRPVSSETSSAGEIIQEVDTESSDVSGSENIKNAPSVNVPKDKGELLENPYLSISAKSNTILKNSALSENSEAEWKKYRNNEFVKHLKQNNFKLKPPFEVAHEEYPPDTFANKPKKHNKSTESGSFTPSSPLKLFWDRHDTYTKDKFKDILGHVNGEQASKPSQGSSQIQNLKSKDEGKVASIESSSDIDASEVDDDRIRNVLQSADSIYNKAVAKAADRLPQNRETQNVEGSVTYSEDFTSDADEFDSEPSATTFSANNYYQNGDDIFRNLKQKFGKPLPRPGSEISDYTFDGNGANNRDVLLDSPIKKKASTSEQVDPHDASSIISEVKTENEDEDVNVTSSLELLQKQLNISYSDLGHTDNPVSMPKIEEEKENNVPTDEKSTNHAVTKVNSDDTATKLNEAVGDAGKISPGSPARIAHTGMNFISAEDYKDKVFDKKQNKYISKDEYTKLYGADTLSPVDNSNKLSSNPLSDHKLDSLSGLSDIEAPTTSKPVSPQVEEYQPLHVPSHKTITKKRSSLKKPHSNDTRLRHQEVSFKLPVQEMRKEKIEGYPANGKMIPSDSTLADLSFSQTNNSLVSAITESYPQEDWELVEQLDISDKNLDKLRGLNKFTPNVWLLDASHNHISHVEGIPQDIQILKLNDNSLTNLASFQFTNLQVLELDGNHLENLSGLAPLTNLTKLSLASNNIANIDHLENFRMLRYLNLSNNEISGQVDFSNYQLWLLEDLILDDNRINSLIGIENLPNLVYLSADRNKVRQLICQGVRHENLKRLSLNSNILTEASLQSFPFLKRLSFNRNNTRLVDSIGKYLEKVSFKYQGFTSSSAGAQIIQNSLRSSSHLQEACFTGSSIDFEQIDLSRGGMFSTITNLNISAMQLTSLPASFSSIFPLLVTLNLNFNNLNTLRGLHGLKHLRKLKMLGNSIEDVSEIIEYTEASRNSIQLFDLRVNPVTKSFYPYVFYDPEDRNEDDKNQLFEEEARSSMTNTNDGSFVDESTVLNLKDFDDIEAFSVEYEKLYSADELLRWHEKDAQFDKKQPGITSKQKKIYQTGLIVWFHNIRCLDGLKITSKRRTHEYHQFLKQRR
ncbi:hypothetical protein HII12_000787 [Brettanomyces bruxellensis]|uniref:Septation initiation network scaffold protein cdc11 n=2 Tax=Dekkera bruxellensis TaxID=5007 RepID=A0A8H6BQC7_DEKBR|nr:hypothetical protein HII12_000787 [Brettanomyces bruxellensis]